MKKTDSLAMIKSFITIFILTFSHSLLAGLTCNFDKSEIDVKNCVGKNIHLTFDDGPHIKYTQKVMDSLKNAGNIPATFFVSTYNFDENVLWENEVNYMKNRNIKVTEKLKREFFSRVKKHIEIRKKIVQDMQKNKNYVLATHAHKHDAHDIRVSRGVHANHFDENESEHEIEKSIQILNNLTDGTFSKQKHKLIRFPYARGVSPSAEEFEIIKAREHMTDSEGLDDYITDHSYAVRNAASLGYSHLRWNHDSEDSAGKYNSKNQDKYIKKFVSNICKRSEQNIISLLHDIQEINSLQSSNDQNKTVLEEIIYNLKCLKANFVGADEIDKMNLAISVYTPFSEVSNQESKKIFREISSGKIHPNQIDYDNCETSKAELVQCQSSVTGQKYNNCEGSSSICFEGKWYSKKSLEKSKDLDDLSIALTCNIKQI